MAFSCVTRNVFSILSLVVLLSITPLSSSSSQTDKVPFSSSFSPTDKVTKPLLNQLCSGPSIYKHFCVAWLISDPKTFTLDLHGLVVAVIQKTVSLGYKNLELTKGLARTTNDPNLKTPYGYCVTAYELSNKALEGAKEFASSGDYLLASKAAFKAFDSITMCESMLEGQAMPPYVAPRNLMFERMVYIGKVFSDFLTF